MDIENKEERILVDEIDEIEVNSQSEDVFYKHDYVAKFPEKPELAFDVVNHFMGLLKDKDVVFENVLMQLEIQKSMLGTFVENSIELKDSFFDVVKRVESYEKMVDEKRGLEYVDNDVVKRKPEHYFKHIKDINESLPLVQMNDIIFKFKDDYIKIIATYEGDKEYPLYQFDFEKIDEVLNKGNNLSLITNIKSALLEMNIMYKEYFDKARSIAYKSVAIDFYKSLEINKSILTETMKKRKVDKFVTAGLRKRLSERYEKFDIYTKKDILAIQDGFTKLCSLFNIAYHYVVTYHQPDAENINMDVFDDTVIDPKLEDKLNFFLIKCIVNHLNKNPMDVGSLLYDLRYENMRDSLQSNTFKHMVKFFLEF